MDEIAQLTVPTATVIILAIDVILGIAVPFVLFLLLRKSHMASVKSFFTGFVIMFLFSMILKTLAQKPIFAAAGDMVNNIWFLGIVSGLMAGLFEEVGRFVAMKWFLKSEMDNNYNALSYGLGHGGFEFMLILMAGMVGNLIIAVLMNSGNAALLTAGSPIDEKAMETLVNGCKELALSSPTLFLVSPIERFAAYTAQMGMSILVWSSVKNKKWYLLPISVLVHTVLDATAVIVFKSTESYFITELIVWIIAILIAIFGFTEFKKMRENK